MFCLLLPISQAGIAQCLEGPPQLEKFPSPGKSTVSNHLPSFWDLAQRSHFVFIPSRPVKLRHIEIAGNRKKSRGYQ